MSQALAGTLPECNLRQRGSLRAPLQLALRYHPSCYYRDLVTGWTGSFAALIAAVSDPGGTITRVHRTWLGLNGGGKARVDDPRALSAVCSARRATLSARSGRAFPAFDRGA